ncbi:hypothetical protein AB4Y44_39840 [Paraburkholderia sp. BR10937]|uniref:hypothetical protein n=1 Tax=Paraburkholderia sp. BR10937 TaxID=3236994 RepID=UPI0034D1D671
MTAGIKFPKIPSGHGRIHIGSVYIDGVLDDGGGIIISPTKDGGVVVTRVPPLEPVRGAMTEVTSFITNANVTTEQLSASFKISATAANQIVEGVAALGGAQAG